MIEGADIDAGPRSGRERMERVLDRLVPAVGDLPAAGAMGLLPEVERMAASSAGYNRSLVRFAQQLSLLENFQTLPASDQDSAIRAIEAAMPIDFAAVLELVYIAYYGRPEVSARIGWRTGPLQPLGFELPPFDEASLKTVRQRQPFWRRA